MPKYTIELEYLVPISQVVVVEADNAEDACAKAHAECEWEDPREWFDAGSRTYVAAIAVGDHNECVCGDEFPEDARVAVPDYESKEAELKRELAISSHS